MNNNFLFKLKMTTILKVVLCPLFVFFSVVFFISCSKFEEEQKQTPVVPNINEAQAIIGGENVFEDYVNIEDFKNVKVEDDITYQKHEKALQKMAKYDKFPNFKEAWDMGNLISEMEMHYDFFSWKFFEASRYGSTILGNFSFERSGYTNYDFAKRSEPFVPCYVETRSDDNGTSTVLLTPKEAKDKISAETRRKMDYDYYNFNKKLRRYFIPLDLYCSTTGIPKEDFKDLRVVSQKFDWYTLWYYQMPHNDNYLDYQNETRVLWEFDELKYYIKKGSLIFVFDRPLEDLYKNINWKELLKFGNKTWGIENWGHMLIVGDWYTDKVNQYHKLADYQLLKEKEDFCNVPFLFKEMTNRDGKFLDYLKHFVFIEAQKDITKNINRMHGFEYNVGVMLTAGNDERLQNYIKNATCVAVVNLNDGYNYSHPDLVNNMIKNAYKQLGKSYNISPYILDTDPKEHYCSGLAYYSFLNNNKLPSLKLVLTKHAGSLTGLSDWIMPRTICNSPFVYTRVWYKK